MFQNTRAGVRVAVLQEFKVVNGEVEVLKRRGGAGRNVVLYGLRGW